LIDYNIQTPLAQSDMALGSTGLLSFEVKQVMYNPNGPLGFLIADGAAYSNL